MIRVLQWTALAVASAAVSGCAPSPSRSCPPGPLLVNARTGQQARWDDFVDDLLQARVVYVGERHDDPMDHRAQLTILWALHGADADLALGMEMFQRPFQQPLDRFARGEIDEKALLERTEYGERWGFDFSLYRPLLRYAREHGLPLVALNARAEIVRAVSHEGLDALPPEDRRELPRLDLDAAEHRALVIDALRHHEGLDEEAVERFYAAQVVWDETMADTVARTLDRSPSPERMVVLAGAMHVLRPAVPARAARRGAAPYRIVLPVEADGVAAHLAADPPTADWLWVR